MIDLGGVNGSCDVTLDASCFDVGAEDDGTRSNNTSNVATRIHFDSMAPESISTVTTRGGVGCSSITMDRKLHAEVRLLSVANDLTTNTTLPSHVDAHSLTSEEVEDVRSVLLDVDTLVRERERDLTAVDKDEGVQSISIETDAYIGEWGIDAVGPGPKDGQMLSRGVDYAQGTMSNRSGEPDSRFDVRSRGKINVDSAAAQALHGFQGSRGRDGESSSSSSDASSSPPLPLLAVASDGRIKLETLSWFGSIARRYGLDEEDTKRVGRQASRTPRLDK